MLLRLPGLGLHVFENTRNRDDTTGPILLAFSLEQSVHGAVGKQQEKGPQIMDPTVITALEALQDLKVAELKKRYHELFGEASKSANKQYLFRRIAWCVQANGEGDLSERARRRVAEIADD